MPQLLNINPTIGLLFAVLIVPPLTTEVGYANSWVVCKMKLSVQGVVTTPYPMLAAQVLSVHSGQPRAECPSKNEVVTFRPENADYQSETKMRDWPKKGRHIKIRYIYLDSICKNDGYEGPCRIKHYPSGW